MPNTPADLTVSLVRLALDASTLEHAAIAHNVANANTPGARVARVDFEQQMAGIRERVAGGGAVGQEMLDRAQPVVRWSAPPRSAQPGSGIDAEVARMTENTVRYQALLKALEGHFSLLSTAINEGRR
jgi:flagellar basal-body rod protein FlgB